MIDSASNRDSQLDQEILLCMSITKPELRLIEVTGGNNVRLLQPHSEDGSESVAGDEAN